MGYSLERDGFSLIEGVLPAPEVHPLVTYLEDNARVGEGRGGIRNLLHLKVMWDLVQSESVRRLVNDAIGVKAHPVRGILFDKTQGSNWKVPWHQDVTIAVTEKIESENYGPWSTKAGVLHVQPPAAVLERMVTIRIHLDDCPKENGALRVIRGSHKLGKLSERVIEKRAKESADDVVFCEIGSGGALVMRPLLIHSSSISRVPAHRRVLHFDFADVELPIGMRWAAGQA